MLDGEGVILRSDGVSDFDRLHARGHDNEVQLLGFDLLELDGTDLRKTLHAPYLSSRLRRAVSAQVRQGAARRRRVAHEIKHDGFRLMVRHAGARVRLFTRNGHDWAERYPAIVMAAATPQARSFLIDGEVASFGD